MIAPPAIFLYLCKQTFDDFCEVAAQNVYHKPLGAYTGEISVPMLSEANIGWAIIGHSERRQYFKETDEVLLNFFEGLSSNIIH